ncbi:phosphoenolpyruvate--protein phosphotransferase [Calothrix sp. UHCC 0171]|uniref:phosphoenolpyruvate--protein phosphotransferase n=1 Tax=Calothrix sp. UHCC 0171 TaxID=3110245 RepID=UPI002B20FD97|nr:phosphoenolpyruvate--protein phosphotransferase [Calothrix sp. UHCC 0171]MEA5572580.1 phosphoenolpyruvate--protein phosphotransferase [Calothrix sp. UHCC 0171]
MVGIVIVSHSKRLAEGVRELAVQMVQGIVPLAVAGGVDDVENPLGTDVIQVHQAIESVYSDAGVVVLMDMGSALMSAEMALEFLTEAQRQNIHLCEAPLVEGAIAAVVSAAAGSNIEQVIAEARGALMAKASQLGINVPVTNSYEPAPTPGTSQTKEIHLAVSNRMGLHARPAAQFVATAARFLAQIKVRNITKKTEYVRADSINQVAMLGVRHGHELAISATGVDADAALAALQALVEDNFGEGDNPIYIPEEIPQIPRETTPVSIAAPSLKGIPASPGVAIAPIYRYSVVSLIRHQLPTLKSPQYYVEDTGHEWQCLQDALNSAAQEITTLLSQASTQIGDAEAAIFDAHLLFLGDPIILEALQHYIFVEHINAASAWQAVVEELSNQYRTHSDSYLRSRAADVLDVGQRVLRLLLGTAAAHLNLTQPAILVATDLTPSDTAQLDTSKVLGICTTAGSSTSHTAIIARSLGIPAVVGIPDEILRIDDGTVIGIDGDKGYVWIEPNADIVTALAAESEAWQTSQQKVRENAHRAAITTDGKQMTVLANIGGVADAQVAVSMGAEGVGLLRTEFLYLDRTTAPSEEEQFAVYQGITQVLESRPVVIRTLDVGGDKPAPYLNLPPENNPFLGWRGIRFCLDRQELFKIQLRAILRASISRTIKIMFPMISTIGELHAAKIILEEVKNELRQGRIFFDENIKVGIMVEVPSAVAIADQLAAEVDFFSIGTNDLSQYVMACDRTNPQVASLADALHPAVLRMVLQTVQSGHKAGIAVSLCGELGSDPIATPILLGFGIDDVSLNPQAIPRFKKSITRLSLIEAEAIASEALKQDSATKVREMLATFNYW